MPRARKPRKITVCVIASRLSLPASARLLLTELLLAFPVKCVRHTDFPGPEADVHNLAHWFGIQVVIHPGKESWEPLTGRPLRAFCTPDAANLDQIKRPSATNIQDAITASDMIMVAPSCDVTLQEKISGRNKQKYTDRCLEAIKLAEAQQKPLIYLRNFDMDTAVESAAAGGMTLRCVKKSNKEKRDAQ